MRLRFAGAIHHAYATSAQFLARVASPRRYAPTMPACIVYLHQSLMEASIFFLAVHSTAKLHLAVASSYSCGSLLTTSRSSFALVS